VTAAADVLARLRTLAGPARVAGMARYGIGGGEIWGVTVAELRAVAKDVGCDPALAAELWASGVHEARILASLVDDPAQVDADQFERWAADFASWDLCDQVCQNLFRHSPLAWTKAPEWVRREAPFVKRAGFTLMAGLAVADKRADDERFAAFLDDVAATADDDRPIVRKGASWALRQIGKRNAFLRTRAIATAEGLRERGGRGSRWIANDVLRELRGAQRA
jgi:3-methyladenine DNA glycosylase AlkD